MTRTSRTGFVALTLGGIALVSAITTAPAFAATLTPSATTVVAGSTVTLTGAGFTQSNPVTANNVTFTIDNPTTTLGTATSDATGNVSFVATVPAATTAGAHTITANCPGCNPATSATASITVTQPTAATLAVSPTQGATGSTVAFIGAGYTASSSTTITADTAQQLATTTTDAAGNIPANVSAVVPTTLSVGAHTITARDAAGRTGTAIFTVTSPTATTLIGAPTITVTPGVVAQGQTATLAGAGFPANASEQAALFSDPVVLANFSTDAAGNFSITVTIPPFAQPGQHQIIVGLVGGAAQAATPVTVTGTTVVTPVGATPGAAPGSGSNQQEQQQQQSVALANPSAQGSPATPTPNGRIPFTGAPVITKVVVGFSLLLAGAGLVLTSKRMRRTALRLVRR
jgi:hypothetical protein